MQKVHRGCTEIKQVTVAAKGTNAQNTFVARVGMGELTLHVHTCTCTHIEVRILLVVPSPVGTTKVMRLLKLIPADFVLKGCLLVSPEQQNGIYHFWVQQRPLSRVWHNYHINRLLNFCILLSRFGHWKISESTGQLHEASEDLYYVIKVLLKYSINGISCMQLALKNCQVCHD